MAQHEFKCAAILALTRESSREVQVYMKQDLLMIYGTVFYIP